MAWKQKKIIVIETATNKFYRQKLKGEKIFKTLWNTIMECYKNINYSQWSMTELIEKYECLMQNISCHKQLLWCLNEYIIASRISIYILAILDIVKMHILVIRPASVDMSLYL